MCMGPLAVHLVPPQVASNFIDVLKVILGHNTKHAQLQQKPLHQPMQSLGCPFPSYLPPPHCQA